MQATLDGLDHIYLGINVCITTLYMLHFHRYIDTAQNIEWGREKVGIFNTVGSCLLQLGVYDIGETKPQPLSSQVSYG